MNIEIIMPSERLSLDYLLIYSIYVKCPGKSKTTGRECVLVIVWGWVWEKE
jgi:hypothetical protein